MNYELQEQINPFLEFLKDRFRAKIDPERYYLAYSGGKDSHFLYWFIKEHLREERIEIVGVNTSFEIPEIRDRILRNCDTVLHPTKSRWDIKENYGIPCFSKNQDEYIYRYQNGSRTKNTMKAILGKNTYFNINKTARSLLLSGNLHKVSNKCCYYNKELPAIRYAREHDKKPILGIRGSESKMRKAAYTSCMKKNGDFSPIYDFSNVLIESIYEAYNIEIPNCYTYIARSGCAGCPYGHNVEPELSLLPELQQRQAVEYFKESYDVKGIDYMNLQMVLDLKRG